MEREFYLSQIYLPHYFIQEDNVSSHLCDMNLDKPIRLQIYTYDAHEVLFDGVLTSEDIEYIQNLWRVSENWYETTSIEVVRLNK